jgi:hypothetical protein
MFRFALLATAASAIQILKDAGAGDPQCHNGHRSFFKEDNKGVEVCCPAYCGKCDDYADCKEVNGQASENACCATKVQSLSCVENAEDPYCLKSCEEKSAPCYIPKGTPFEAPEKSGAEADCNEAVKDAKNGYKATVKGVDADPDHATEGDAYTGEDSWKDLQEGAASAKNADAAKFARNNDSM